MGILNIQNNINIYILLFLFSTYFLVKKYNKQPLFDETDTQITFLKNLDYFFMKNKLVTYFAIILYFSFSSLIFLFFRLQFVGSSTFIFISLPSFEVNTLFNIILFLINIKLYLQILDIMFYYYVLQLHFYLYTKKWYIAFNDLNRDNYMLISNCFLKILGFVYKKNGNNWYTNIILSLLSYLHNYASRFIYYMPFIFVIMSIIYDLQHSLLYYSYYTLLFFLITNFIKKIRKFYYEKDCVYDNIISNHFYAKNNYHFLQNQLDVILEKDYLSIITNCETVLGYANEITHYFKNGFKVYYLIDPVSVEGHKTLNSQIKNFHALLLLILCNIYFIYNFNKYKILFPFISLEIKPVYILIPLLIVTFICNLYKARKLFIFLILLQSVIILFIMLKNKIILTPSELLLNWEYMCIEENISVNEKKEYLMRYILLISPNIFNDTAYEIIYKNWLLSSINITNDLSMEDLRKIIHSLVISLINNTDPK